jgi:hypothetical protein
MSYLGARCPVRIKAPAFGAGEPGFKSLRARHFLGVNPYISEHALTHSDVPCPSGKANMRVMRGTRISSVARASSSGHAECSDKIEALCLFAATTPTEHDLEFPDQEASERVLEKLRKIFKLS